MQSYKFERDIREDLPEKPVLGQRGGESECDGRRVSGQIAFQADGGDGAKGLKQNLSVWFKELQD